MSRLRRVGHSWLRVGRRPFPAMGDRGFAAVPLALGFVVLMVAITFALLASSVDLVRLVGG